MESDALIRQDWMESEEYNYKGFSMESEEFSMAGQFSLLLIYLEIWQPWESGPAKITLWARVKLLLVQGALELVKEKDKFHPRQDMNFLEIFPLPIKSVSALTESGSNACQWISFEKFVPDLNHYYIWIV